MLSFVHDSVGLEPTPSSFMMKCFATQAPYRNKDEN